MTILSSLLSQPTAPFHEEKIIEQVRRWAHRRRADFRRDKAGNVFVHYHKGRRKGPRWVFAAHMDHPGFVVRFNRGRSVWADFFGSVEREYFPGSSVRLFCPDGEILSTVRSVRAEKGSHALLCRLEPDKPADVPVGTVGMWNLPAMRIRRKRLVSRACDDVVGSAAVLCAMNEVISRKIDTDVTAMLTRGEEYGFVGALAACEDHESIPRDAMIIAIETSKVMPKARLGDGVVVRVGDAMRTFDPSLTTHVTAVARALSKRDRNFRFVRQLMPGGTCESTVYNMWDYMTTALCLPLLNYHNRAPNGRIAAEQIHTDDFASLVKIIVAIAAEKKNALRTDLDMKKHLRHLLKTRRKYL
ncbi:MAG: hypothetical protein SVV80_02095 [Planctomycetota bacterium]|nr:hypothetical protein [Planctomycetota bacterium]